MEKQSMTHHDKLHVMIFNSYLGNPKYHSQVRSDQLGRYCIVDGNLTCTVIKHLSGLQTVIERKDEKAKRSSVNWKFESEAHEFYKRLEEIDTNNYTKKQEDFLNEILSLIDVVE